MIHPPPGINSAWCMLRKSGSPNRPTIQLTAPISRRVSNRAVSGTTPALPRRFRNSRATGRGGNNLVVGKPRGIRLYNFSSLQEKKTHFRGPFQFRELTALPNFSSVDQSQLSSPDYLKSRALQCLRVFDGRCFDTLCTVVKNIDVVRIANAGAIQWGGACDIALRVPMRRQDAQNVALNLRQRHGRPVRSVPPTFGRRDSPRREGPARPPAHRPVRAPRACAGSTAPIRIRQTPGDTAQRSPVWLPCSCASFLGLHDTVRMGWVVGFEPTATGTTIRRSTKLSYTHRVEESSFYQTRQTLTAPPSSTTRPRAAALRPTSRSRPATAA